MSKVIKVPKSRQKRTFWIDLQMRENWLALFKEIEANGQKDGWALHAWYLSNVALIKQSIMELQYLDTQ